MTEGQAERLVTALEGYLARQSELAPLLLEQMKLTTEVLRLQRDELQLRDS